MPTDHQRTSLHSRRRSFRHGFLQRNPLVLVAAGAACLLVVLGLQHFFFGGGMTRVSEDRLLRIEHDDSLHLAYRVNRLKQDPPSGPVVYVFGGSGAMEAVAADRAFARQIAAGLGEPVTAVSLAGHAQSLAQNLVIVDNLPDGEATLLIGLAPMRFNTAPAADVGLLSSRVLLLRSPRLRELAPRLYGREASWTGGLPGACDFISAYVQERLAEGPAPGAPVKWARHYFGRDAEAVATRTLKDGLGSVYRYNRTHYAANHEYNLTLLRELVRLSRERGFEPVFFEQPLNTSVAGDWAGVLPKCRADAERLSRELGVPYVRVDRLLALDGEDFVDLYHLMPAARARWQARMADEVGELLRFREAAAAR